MYTLKITGIPRVVRNMEGRAKALPKASQRGLQRIAQFAVAQYRLSARGAGLKPWGGGARELFRDIKAVKYSNRAWLVKMPIHGIYQDRMKGHFVHLRRGRNITKWAKSHGVKGYRSPHGGLGIWTKPHPFMRRAENVTFKNARKIIETEINRAMKRRT